MEMQNKQQKQGKNYHPKWPPVGKRFANTFVTLTPTNSAILGYNVTLQVLSAPAPTTPPPPTSNSQPLLTSPSMNETHSYSPPSTPLILYWSLTVCLKVLAKFLKSQHTYAYTCTYICIHTYTNYKLPFQIRQTDRLHQKCYENLKLYWMFDSILLYSCNISR